MYDQWGGSYTSNLYKNNVCAHPVIDKGSDRPHTKLREAVL
jgi:hypothetical protein